MSLREGAETIISQCLDVKDEETVLVLNDSNDKAIIDSLLEVLEDRGLTYQLIEYEEPENHGDEPSKHVSKAMKEYDVVIAPTMKSLSHTEARKEANKQETRIVTLPRINREIWNSSLQADYQRVKEITEKVYSLLEEASEVRVTTPSGTDLSFEVDIDTYHKDTGIIKDEGDFGNLPAGEPNGYPENMNGVLVTDHFPFSPKAEKVEIKNSEVVSLESRGKKKSELEEAFEEHPCVRKIAEFGFGTNPEASLIGKTLQDEKVLGTVHFAFGDNCAYVKEGDERRNPCPIHWDTVCEDPTVFFDGRKILDEGEPVFLED